MKKIALLCATTAFVMPGLAFAQSTGSIAVEEEEVVVTGTRGPRDVIGVQVPDAAKSASVLNQEFISQQAPGQSILQTINLIPGVNFTNSDPYGSSGGNLRIRGFDGNRISLTFDGIPLNDSGNYAIFSNQQLDPEIIEQVNVNMGSTDIDSPTASAAGGTVNYRTIVPNREFGLRAVGSLGTFDYRRVFGMVESGEMWENGPRAFATYSNARNDLFRGPGEIYKQQFNVRIYQSLGSNGDFISVAGHYNRNRNNFYRNPSVSDLRGALAPGFVIPANATITPDNPFRIDGAFTDAEWATVFLINNLDVCTRGVPGAGAQNDNGGRPPSGSTAPANTAPAVLGNTANNPENTSSCVNFAGIRLNPSNTGNVRVNGRFTLMDNLILTVDPSFQYVLANGGGSTALGESSLRVRGATPASPGVDYNRDGDFADTIRFYTPNNTNTHRLGLTASLIWDIADNHRVRVAYTYDRARHRQTGEWGFLTASGDPESPFSGRNATPVVDATGFQIQQRDRISIALLNQIAGQYIGRFFDDRLRVEVGVRAPFFRRDLDTRCPIQAADGFAYCTSEAILPRGSAAPPGAGAGTVPVFVNQGDCIATTAPCNFNPAFRPLYAPFTAKYSFDDILPNVGLVYDFGGGLSVFGSYAAGLSAPRTDNLYRAPVVDIEPETTDAFDLGIRYRRSNIQAQAVAWMINYQNRIVSSFNPDLGISIDRNVGKVESWGLDLNFAVEPIPEISLIGLFSYINAELQENVQIQGFPAGSGVTSCNPLTPAAAPFCAATAGKFVAETPEYQIGGRVQLNFGPLTMGWQGKWVGQRFVTDINDLIVDDYAVIDFDARFDLGSIGLEDSYLQLNVINILNERYFGNISTQINAAGNPNFSTGSPRTFMVSLNIAYR